MLADDISALIGLELLKTIKRPVIWMQAPMMFSMAKFKRSGKCCPSSLGR
jgi:hypothetical protein